MDVHAIDTASVNAGAVSSSAPPAPPSAGHQGAKAVRTPAGDETLHRALSELTGNGARVSVQFKVTHDPNQIVTVFTNADTGQVISQFPAETMVLIAQFFNKLAGAVLDKTI